MSVPQSGGRIPRTLGQRFQLGLGAIGQPHKRQRLLKSLVLVLLVVFAARLVYVQVGIGPELKALADAQSKATRTEPAIRGQIISADGTVLAADAARWAVEAAPNRINERDKNGKYLGIGPEQLAAQLAPLVGQDESELLVQLSDPEVKWLPLLEHATLEQWEPIEQLIDSYWEHDRIDIGVVGVKHYVRAYPAGTIAGNLIGYSYEIDDNGENYGKKFYTGLEQVLSEQLAGKPGFIEVESGANGQPIPGGEVISDPAQPGCDVTLTINSVIQLTAQEAIQAQVEQSKAAAGMVVVIDVATGEVLALADSDTSDPSNPTGGTAGYQNSRALENVFAPGSTGKVVTMAMLLEEGYATPSSQYTVPWQWVTGGQAFRDSDEHKTARWTLTGILAKSSNIGTLMAAEAVPDQVRYDYLKKFGFGEPTGVEFPSELEAWGTVHKPGDMPAKDGDPYWDGRTRSAVLFGQGMTANAVQVTEVYATLGNGGLRAQPHLIKGMTCSDGLFQPTQLAEPERVVSEETASQVVAMLESAVEEGTGKTARVAGYRTAGKTGTSKESDSDTNYVASFVGLVPAEAPRIAVGVFIIDPQGDHYGSLVAAPVFEHVTAVALDRLGVAPSTTAATLLPSTW